MTSIHRRDVVKALGVSPLALSMPWSASAQTQTPRRGGALKVAVSNDNTKTLDPMLSVQQDERPKLYLIYNCITGLRPDFSIEPDLATEWKIEKDGTRYIFTLREGVKFHDGTPFNSEAVKWNIMRRLDPEMKSPTRNILGPVIGSIETPAENTVIFNLNYPYPALLADLADRPGFMVSPTASQKFGADFGRNPVGTGPFIFKRWVDGTSIAVERNPNYWLKGMPYLDSVEFVTVANTPLGIQRINIGELDYIDRLAAAEVRQVDKSRVQLMRHTVGRWFPLQWQVDKPPFNNPKLRQAIAHAIDKDQIRKIILDGQGDVANAVMPAEGLWFSNKPKVTIEYSPAKAKELLKESGWPMEDTMTLYAPGDTNLNKITELVGEQLKQIGLKVVLQPVAQAEYYAKVVRREVNFTPTTWTPRADPDTIYYFLLHSKGGGNTTGYASPEADALMEAGRKSQDQAERRRIYGEVDALVMKDLPYVPLYFGVDYMALSNKLQGFQPVPDQMARFRYTWKTA